MTFDRDTALERIRAAREGSEQDEKPEPDAEDVGAIARRMFNRSDEGTETAARMFRH